MCVEEQYTRATDNLNQCNQALAATKQQLSAANAETAQLKLNVAQAQSETGVERSKLAVRLLRDSMYCCCEKSSSHSRLFDLGMEQESQRVLQDANTELTTLRTELSAFQSQLKATNKTLSETKFALEVSDLLLDSMPCVSSLAHCPFVLCAE